MLLSFFFFFLLVIHLTLSFAGKELGVVVVVVLLYSLASNSLEKNFGNNFLCARKKIESHRIATQLSVKTKNKDARNAAGLAVIEAEAGTRAGAREQLFFKNFFVFVCRLTAFVFGNVFRKNGNGNGKR